MRFLSLLSLAISVCTGREHHHSLGALKPHSMSETMKEPTYHELIAQNSKLKREIEILKAQGSGMERSGDESCTTYQSAVFMEILTSIASLLLILIFLGPRIFLSWVLFLGSDLSWVLIYSPLLLFFHLVLGR